MITVQITKHLGDFSLDVQFEAPRGVTALFGRSGSGKTSVINAIAGLLRPDTGQISVAGRRLTDMPVHMRNLGYVFQDARLFPHMTVAQNLSYGGGHDAARIIDLLGLAPLLDRRPRALSGGEKSRVALGRALMSNPAMLLLDEPLAALDTQRKAEILPYLERLRDDMAIPMIYVSHDVAEVARLANTLVVLEAGQVVRAGPVEAVLADPAVAPFVGLRGAGAVLQATVAGYDAQDGLTHVTFDAGSLALSGQVGRIGGALRVHIPAQDVILAKSAPTQISARNILPVTVQALTPAANGGVMVSLRAGSSTLLARITQASLREMALAEGQEIFAIVKASVMSAPSAADD